jgi:hypothetical protein
MFCLNDSLTGYQWKFFLYRGKDEQRPMHLSATTYPVWKLTRSPVLHHRNHILHTDNWYTNLIMITLMRSIGVHVVGTVKSNVKGLPTLHIDQKANRGDMIVQSTKLKEHPIYFISWMDKKPVNLLSTFPTDCDKVTRNSKNRTTERYEKIKIARPTNVNQYNHGMGGTDLCDQFISYYRIALRTRHWRRKIYAHMLNVVAVNAPILYKNYRSINRSHNGYTLKNFITILMKQLADIVDSDIAVDVTPIIEVSPRLNTQLGHEPIIYKRPRDERTRKQDTDLRRDCVVCGLRVATACYICKKYLCLRVNDDPEQT